MTTVYATLYHETESPIPMTCTNATGIEKGTFLTLSDPMTCAAVTDSRTACAGIAAEEKIASDGRTKIGVYRGGYFIVTASGAITVGDAINFQDGYAGAVQPGDDHVWGTALETAAAGETFLMQLRPISISQRH